MGCNNKLKKLEFINIDGKEYPVIRDMTEEEIAAQEEKEREEAAREATDLERLEAQVLYTALMTDTLIKENENA